MSDRHSTDLTKVILGTIVSIVALVATVMGVQSKFVSRETYDSTIAGLNARLDRNDASQARMEAKLDWLIRNNK